MEDINNEPIIKKSRKKSNKKKLDELLNDENISNENPEYKNYYKDKIKVYVLSGTIKDLYGKIITEHELNNLSEQECENIYKIIEVKVAQKISGSVIDGVITFSANVISKFIPIENKDKYISDLQNDYIINSELKNIAGNVAMRTGKLWSLFSFAIITAKNINLYVNKELEKESQEIKQELDDFDPHDMSYTR